MNTLHRVNPIITGERYVFKCSVYQNLERPVITTDPTWYTVISNEERAHIRRIDQEINRQISEAGAIMDPVTRRINISGRVVFTAESLKESIDTSPEYRKEFILDHHIQWALGGPLMMD